MRADEAIKNGASLTGVFEAFAMKTGRAKGSVRNYYYQLIDRAKTQTELKEEFPVLNGLSVSKNVNFTKDEEKRLIDGVEKGVKTGKSVRKTISELAGGDEKLALRFQNKYRNIKCRNNKKVFNDKSAAYSEIADKINGLVDRIGRSLRNENERLKRKVEMLTEENAMLKKHLTKSLVKEYFTSENEDSGDNNSSPFKIG